ncbi:MAG: glycosyltransferase, partial [Casimicrobiaceae bacterium]
MKPPASRNAPCPCGSGRRYKECHGALGRPASSPAPNADALAHAGLAAQQARRLDEAESLYRQALALRPDFPDVLHMLGVVRMERGDPAEAIGLILRALEQMAWQFPEAMHNLGLALGRALAGDGALDFGLGEIGRRYRSEGVQGGRAAAGPTRPRVSVLVPCFNHARFIEGALDSVFAQTYPEIEIIAIDDGSRDDTPNRLAAIAARAPRPMRVICRDNRGAAATLNEAAGLARGEWLQPLNSDDRLPPDRIERMVEAVAARGHSWGFGRVRTIDAQGEPIDPLSDARVFAFVCSQSEIGFAETVGECFLTRNAAISSGNLFISRALFERVGGFGHERWHHDWRFCLEAVFEAEPQYVQDAGYDFRLLESNPIAEARVARLAEVAQMLPPLI